MIRSTSDIVIVLATLGAEADAAVLARTLVDEGLAACVGILPDLTSVFRWEGKVRQEAEQQLVIKTSVERAPALERRLLQLHPYNVPECIVLTGRASEAYARWVLDETPPPS